MKNLNVKPLYAIGFLGLLCLTLPKAARADNFDFSITNTVGSVSGTVTGEIFGLTDNGVAGSASEVLITSYPAGDDSLIGSSSLNATSWDDPLANSFTETGGVITSAEFWAADLTNPGPLELFIGVGGQNGISIPTTFVGTFNQIGTAGVTFTAVAATPEPGTIMLLLTGLGLMGLMVVLQKRKIQGLAQAA